MLRLKFGKKRLGKKELLEAVTSDLLDADLSFHENVMTVYRHLRDEKFKDYREDEVLLAFILSLMMPPEDKEELKALAKAIEVAQKYMEE